MNSSVRESLTHLRARFAAKAAYDREAAQRAQDALPRLVAALEAAGAQRVVLFGSLAEGRFRADGSDIDLAVSGLPSNRELGLMSRLTELAGRQVDLVPLEDAPESLRRRIEEAGTVLNGCS